MDSCFVLIGTRQHGVAVLYVVCSSMLALCPEHPKRDQNPKFTPLSETTSIPVSFIWESPPPPPPWASPAPLFSRVLAPGLPAELGFQDGCSIALERVYQRRAYLQGLRYSNIMLIQFSRTVRSVCYRFRLPQSPRARHAQVREQS